MKPTGVFNISYRYYITVYWKEEVKVSWDTGIATWVNFNIYTSQTYFSIYVIQIDFPRGRLLRVF